MSIDTTFLRRCIASLERAVEGIEGQESGKLLRKRLAPWFASNRQADRLHFKDLFRHAARHGLIPPGAVERWLRYRDNRPLFASTIRIWAFGPEIRVTHTDWHQKARPGVPRGGERDRAGFDRTP